MAHSDLPLKIARHMLENDLFSLWLGIEILEAAPGRSVLQMTVRKEMTNGFKVSHGGVAFSLADSALAFAAGSHGRIAMTIDSSISFFNAVKAGDCLTARAEEENLGSQTAVYNVNVSNQRDETVAVMRGTAYRTKKKFFEPYPGSEGSE